MYAACLLHDHGLSPNVKVTNVTGGLPSVHLTPRDGDVTDHVTSIDWSPPVMVVLVGDVPRVCA